MPRPRGGDWLHDEISGWKLAGLSTVVSLLERHEVRELDLGDEADLCKAAGIDFISFPVVDRGVPTSAHEVLRLVDALASRLRNDTAVAIHCRAGIGRSALLAACLLWRLDIPESVAFQRISEARGIRCPDTEVQVKWFANFVREAGNAL